MTTTRRRPRNDALLVVQVFVLSRLLIVMVGAVLAITQKLTPSEMLTRWDVIHFMSIASDGYADKTSAAFFPGLPLLLRGGTMIGLPMQTTGVLVSLVGSALAAAALYRLFGAPAACLWLLAPTAIFTVVGYTEAPFCAAAFWAWLYARDNKWGQAGILAGLACAFRISGLFLVAALAVQALIRANWTVRINRLVWLLVPVAVLGAFEVYLHAVTGSWTAWLEAQQAGWTRGFTTPWNSLLNTLDAGRLARWPGRPDVAWVFRAEVISMAVGLAATIWCLFKRRLAEAVFIGLQVVAFGTSWWYMSINRAVLTWFPLWQIAGSAVAPNRRRGSGARLASGAAVIVSTALMIIWAWLFFTGKWAS